MRVSAKAIIIRDGHLLALACRRDGERFYILPGGGQEPGESVHDTLKRECREELGVSVVPGPLLFVRDYMGALGAEEPDKTRQQLELMFACELDGTSEAGGGAVPDDYQEGLAWLPTDRLEDYALYPLTLRALLARGGAVPDIYLGPVN